MMDLVLKPNDSECYAPSKPIRCSLYSYIRKKKYVFFVLNVVASFCQYHNRKSKATVSLTQAVEARPIVRRH
jgi:hypothetical protein